ncbi:winged helix-turn-helix domain-containing protein [Micromonospora sp. NPDC023956]|uniref:ArsR/SmtB family transcription factor n=1 Tax=Micromonospora sp. NPDC023956 TaxID=3155722 RepID=UPI0033C7AAF7
MHQTGDELLRTLAALASPHRLRIVASLAEERGYVSELARRLGMNRPLLYMHLQRLEAAGLVTGTLETAPDGSSVKWFDVVPFALELTPATIAAAATTLGADGPGKDDP